MRAMVSGLVDVDYLRAALARAGTTLDVSELTTEILTGGRTAAVVTRLHTRTRDGRALRWVLKVVPQVSWRQAFDSHGCEARLWLGGATRTLPRGLRCPTIDVAYHDDRDAWWILMEDVSGGIAPRGTFDAIQARTFLRSVARMHAQYWARDEELAAIPVVGFERSANGFASLMAMLARGEPPTETWMAQLSEDFWVPRLMLPALLHAAGPAGTDLYIRLCKDHARIADALARFPRTLCHGDLRRANISHVGDEVVLFDWEFASCAPAARDLQWYWFLHFWAYPTDDRDPTQDPDGLLDAYVDELERARGTRVDREELAASLELGWLSTFCQIGCCLADPLVDPSASADAIARAKRNIAHAFTRARELATRYKL